MQNILKARWIIKHETFSALLFISLQNIPVDRSTDFDHQLNLADLSHMHTTLQTALAKLLTLDYVQHSRSSMLKKFNHN